MIQTPSDDIIGSLPFDTIMAHEKLPYPPYYVACQSNLSYLSFNQQLTIGCYRGGRG